mgnify:CR=1 FL=1
MSELRDFYDVVVVGAGVGGGAIANRLASAGARVLMIERGTRLPREADNWSVKAVFHDRKYAAKETWRDRDGKEFNPSTYYYVGGNSKFFGAATVRFRAEDFEDLQHEGGVAPAWMERISRSTSESREKSVVIRRTTRNTFTGVFRVVPIVVKIVMVFIVMSTWQ